MRCACAPALQPMQKRLHALISAEPDRRASAATHAGRHRGARRAVRRGRAQSEIVGCRNSAPLSAQVAEVRSLVVNRSARNLSVSSAIVEGSCVRAALSGFDRLSAAHAPGISSRWGFRLFRFLWTNSEKVYTDCVTTCPQFRRPASTNGAVAPTPLTRFQDHPNTSRWPDTHEQRTCSLVGRSGRRLRRRRDTQPPVSYVGIKAPGRGIDLALVTVSDRASSGSPPSSRPTKAQAAPVGGVETHLAQLSHKGRCGSS